MRLHGSDDNGYSDPTELTVPARVSEGLAIHRMIWHGKPVTTCWTLTHVNTGKSTGLAFNHLKDAKEYAEALAATGLGQYKAEADIPLSVQRACLEVANQFKNRG